MRMTSALLLVVVGLALWLFYRQDRVEPAGAAAEAVLEGRRLAQATRIVIWPAPDQLGIEFRRHDRGWQMVEPIRDDASIAALEAVAAAYDEALLQPALPDGEVDAAVLEQSGVETPRGKLAAYFPDRPEPIVVELGADGPMLVDVFARKDGELYRVQKALLSSIQLTVDDFREHFVFRNTLSQVHRVEVARGAGLHDGLVVQRTARGEFELVEPAVLRLDQGAVQQLVQAVLGLRVDRFLGGKLNTGEALGPPLPPDVVIRVEGAAGRESAELRTNAMGYAGEAEPRGISFATEEQTLRRVLDVPIESLRARWLLPFAVADASRILLDPGVGGTPLELAIGASEEFGLVKPVRAAADPTAVAELLQAIRGLGVTRFVEDGAADLDRYGLAERPLRLRIVAGREETVIEFGRDDGAETFARRGDEPHVFTVPRAVVEVVRRAWTSYGDREILAAKLHASIRTVRWTGGGTERVYRRVDGNRWEGGPAASSLPDVIDLLRGLRASAVIDPAAAELGEPCTLDCLTESGDRLHRLLLYPAGERVLCRLADLPLLYELRGVDGRLLMGLGG